MVLMKMLLQMNRFFLYIGLLLMLVAVQFLDYPIVDGYYYAIAPLVAPLIIAGATLASGAASALSQSSSNKINKAINDKNLLFQQQENEKNRDFQRRMWNAQNVYNTPKHLMQLNREAGLNPYLISDAAATSTAGSPGSPSMQGAPSAIPNQPIDYSFIGQAGQSMGNMLLQSKQVEANVNQQNQQSMQIALDNALEVGKKFNDWDTARNMYLTAVRQYGGKFDAENSPEMELFNANKRAAIADAANREFELQLSQKYKPKQIEQAIARTDAEIENFKILYKKYEKEVSLIESQKNLTESQIKESKQRLENLKKEFEEIGSRIAANYASAFNLQMSGNLAAANAQTVDDSRQYIIKRLRIASDIESDQYADSHAVFLSGSNARHTLATNPTIRKVKDFNVMNRPDINPVLNVVQGFTQSFGTHIGFNTNF